MVILPLQCPCLVWNPWYLISAILRKNSFSWNIILTGIHSPATIYNFSDSKLSKSFLKKSSEWLLKWVIYWIAPLLLNSNFNYVSIRVNNWYNNKLTYLNSLGLFYGNGGYGLKWILVIPLKYFLNYSWNSSNMMPARMIQICFKNV